MTYCQPFVVAISSNAPARSKVSFTASCCACVNVASLLSILLCGHLSCLLIYWYWQVRQVTLYRLLYTLNVLLLLSHNLLHLLRGHRLCRLTWLGLLS